MSVANREAAFLQMFPGMLPQMKAQVENITNTPLVVFLWQVDKKEGAAGFIPENDRSIVQGWVNDERGLMVFFLRSTFGIQKDGVFF